jgi:hypothetical protein
MKLTRVDGTEVKPGDEITDFRGDKSTFVGITGPTKIHVKKDEMDREFYPSVFDLIITLDK